MKYRLFQALREPHHGPTHRSRRRFLGITALPFALSALLSMGPGLDTAFAAAKPKAKASSAKVTPASPPDSAQPSTDRVGTDKVGADNAGADTTAAEPPAKPGGDGAENADAVGKHSSSPSPAPDEPAVPGFILDCAAVERRAQEIHPILREKELDIAKAEQQMRDLEMAAILPRFQLETGMGPAPGLKTLAETTLVNVDGGGSGYFQQYHKDYDFNDWGPFFGIEMTVAQPLNLSRYRAGHKAAAANIKVAEAQFQKEKLDVSEEAQKLYYQRVYAGQMFRILKDATKELDGAQKQMEEMLDEGDESIKQTDLLELKAGRYALEKSRNEAGLGMARADLGLRFLLQIPDGSGLALKDSMVALRSEALPSLDSLKMLTLVNHPDLKRLANGLAARRELVRVAKGEIGPDIFLFGSFKYTKAWSTDRQSGGEDPFARDPLNEITGVGGLGMRLNLNFWSRYQKVRKERIELTQLERTEVYAARGLVLKMQDEYIQMLNHRANVTEAQKSLRAAEAWLKGAALKYDLDPSTAKDMISPYKTVLGAKRDYFEAVMNYNLAVAKVIKSTGWTLTDYFHSLGGAGSVQSAQSNP